MTKLSMQKHMAISIALVVAFVLAFACFGVAMLAGNAAVAQAEPATEAGYYLVGLGNDWTAKTEYQLTENPNAAGEYYIIFTVEQATSFKIVHFNGSDNDVWYPGNGDNYGISAGNYTVYFRPTGGVDGWYHGLFYVAQHTHAYSEGWTSDAFTHWHACTAGGGICTEPKADEAAHTYGDSYADPSYYTCSVCDYEDATRKADYVANHHDHDYSSVWATDATYHWHECNGAIGTCDAPEGSKGEHVYGNDLAETAYYTCATCGYVNATRKGVYDQAINHDGIVFTPWESTTSLPGEAGNYFLTANVALSDSWNVPSGTTKLCLNGHSVTQTAYASVVIVNSGATLYLMDCDDTVHYYTPNHNGPAALSNVATDYSFVGGYLTGGRATDDRGGALRILGSGNVVFSGGTLFGNRAGWGGGIYTDQDGSPSLTIEGTAAIIGNYSSGSWTSGGGMFLDNGPATVTMTGGSIRHNSAQYSGGGVQDNIADANGHFTMTGGEITGNYSGEDKGNGFAYDNATSLYIGGSARIIDNEGTNDVYVRGTDSITVVAPFTADAAIGVKLANGSGTFTNGWTTQMGSADPADVFVSNNDDYVVYVQNSEAKIGVAYTFTYDANGGLGSMVDAGSPYASDTYATVQANAFTRMMYDFNGWNTQADGQGTSYTAGDVIAMNANLVLYAQWVEHEFDEFIHFDVTVAGGATNADDVTLYVDDTNIGDTITVTYKMTHNDGFNSILLVPDFDTDVFEIAANSDIVVSNVLGDALITNEFEGRTIVKIELGSTNVGPDRIKYTGIDTGDAVFLTITYTIKAALDGEYDFGLKILPYEERNSTVAFYNLTDELANGEQVQVGVECDTTNSLILVVKQLPEFTTGYNRTDGTFADTDTTDYYLFVYDKYAVSVDQTTAMSLSNQDALDETLAPADADGLNVYYIFAVGSVALQEDDDNMPAVGVAWWYYNDAGSAWATMGDDVPSMPGTYKAVLTSAPTNLYYEATADVYVVIVPRPVTVTIDDKSSAYGDAIEELTHQPIQNLCSGDSLVITLSTSQPLSTSSVPGTYTISGMVDVEHSEGYIVSNAYGSDVMYAVTVVSGTYTITQKAITVTATSIEVQYSGEAPTIDQDGFTVTGIDKGSMTATITLIGEGIEPGTYTLDISDLGGLTNAQYYDITYVDGTFKVLSRAVDSAYFDEYFSGRQLPYNGAEQDLLLADDDPNDWWSYTASGNLQTNVKYVDEQVADYTITITVTVEDNDYYHVSGNTNQVVFNVYGTITPANVTLSVVSVERTYGQAPVTVPEFSVLGTSEQLNHGYDFVDFAPTADLAVGEYDIVLIPGSNPNFNVEYVDGTYTVTMANASVSATAGDVYYNRALNNVISASVNTLSLTPTVSYYSDSACTQAATPVSAGTYWVKAEVAGNANYNGAEAIASFAILPVKLQGVSFTYSHGNATWTAVANDIGKTDTEEGVAAAALKEGTTVSYEVYDGDTKVATIAAGDARTFDAVAATTYKVVAIANDANYLNSESTMVAAYEVSFDDGDHTANPDTPAGMPAVQYVFAGETAIAPATDPSLVGCTFIKWQVAGVDYAFVEAVNNDVTVVAVWNAVKYTITFKYFDEADTLNTNVFEILVDHNSNIELPAMTPAHPVESGKTYTFNNTWQKGDAAYGVSEGKLTLDNVLVVATADATFVAQYDVTLGQYTVRFYWTHDDADYQVYASDDVTFGAAITYPTMDAVALYRHSGWYTEAARTNPAPATMPAEDIDVYMSYVFDIGVGDVNADGLVNADDITLYRQWIVGGYAMEVIAEGTEWATVNDEGFADSFAANAYFFRRVADGNADLSRDIRDVAIIRMAVAGGYNWDIFAGSEVTGQGLSRVKALDTLAALESTLLLGNRTILYANIDAASQALAINVAGNVYVDLGGKDLTVSSACIIAGGHGSVITIKNGTIHADGGITISAPNGTVVIENVEAYVDGQPINLQAANQSLHLAGNVAFYDESIVPEPGQNYAPATVQVAENTHVVVEQAAEVVVEKIKVATVAVVNNVPTFTADTTKAITLDNKAENSVEVVGNIANSITDFAGLAAAIQAGGAYVLGADIACDTDLVVTTDFTLDLGGHAITFESWGFDVRNGATLTFGGNGSVTAAEAALYAQYAGKLVVNGGTFTSTENFVIGTHGSSGRGGNVITINGGTFNASMCAEGVANGYIACGIYVANNDTVVLNGGTFNVTDGVGIVARSGNTTVGSGVVLNMLGTSTASGKVGDSSKPRLPAGVALALDLVAGYPGGAPTLVNNSTYDVHTVVGTVEQMSAAFAAGGNVILGSDVAGIPYVAIGADTTLNLNGYNLTFNKWGLCVDANAAQPITLTVGGNGNVSATYPLDVENGNYLVVNGGTYTATECAVVAYTGGHVTINGGTFNALDNSVISTNGKAGYGGNVITVNGGTFNGTITTAGYVACGIYVANSDTVTVNGGTFNVTNGVGIVARSGNTTVGSAVVFNMLGDNVISGKVGDASKPKLPAGVALALDLVAGYPGGAPTLVNNSTYDVHTVVGTVEQISAAFAAGGNVILGSDIAVSGTTNADRLTITVDTNLDLNGYTLKSADGLEPTGNWSTLWVAGGAVANIKNGTIGACYDSDNVTAAPYGITVGVKNGTAGTVNLYDVNVKGGTSAVYVILGEANVYSGTYEASPWVHDNVDDYNYLLNCYDANYLAGTAVINVYGGSFVGVNPAACRAEDPATDFVAEGYVSVEDNGVWTVSALQD